MSHVEMMRWLYLEEGVNKPVKHSTLGHEFLLVLVDGSQKFEVETYQVNLPVTSIYIETSCKYKYKRLQAKVN